MVLGTRFRFDLGVRAIATASFEPRQQRQSPVCPLTICPLHGTYSRFGVECKTG
jgi:hypothetical protein